MPQTQKEDAIGLRAVCFVDMPFGKKSDLASGVEVDFDVIYESAIKPAITDCNLEPVRGDQERTGGIVHAPMFGRLLLSDYVVGRSHAQQRQRLLRTRHPPYGQAVHYGAGVCHYPLAPV